MARKDVNISTPKQQINSTEVSINIKEAIRAAKELIQKSAALKRDIARGSATNAHKLQSNELTPKIIDF